MADLEPMEVTVPVPDAVKAVEVDIGAEKPKDQLETKKTTQNDFESEGIELLRRQLEEKKREADEARRLKSEAERRAAEREREITTYKVEARDSQLTSFVNAIASYERDAEMLERDYASKLADGDYNGAAKLQRQMAQVESRLMQLEQGKAAVEERLEVERHQAANPQPLPPVYETPQDPIEAQIRGLSPAAQQWIRSNPHVLTDPVAKNAMTGAHYMAVARNIPLDSPEYFSFIEGEIANNSENAPSAQPQPRQQRPFVTAAPVSRSAGPNMRSNGSMTITLNAAQREAARDMDLSDEEYAANLAYYINKGDIRG